MTGAAIASLPVDRIAAGDPICFLWATVPLLPDTVRVLEAWGFDYKTALLWYKTPGAPGMGYWFRGSAEAVLIGTRGRVQALGCQRSNVIEAPRRQHSKKPAEFWKLVNHALAPHALKPRLELFCWGHPPPGWDGWGNEAIGGVDLPALEAVPA
jgi:N6-adenosine-specific RNA methylase IME4